MDHSYRSLVPIALLGLLAGLASAQDAFDPFRDVREIEARRKAEQEKKRQAELPALERQMEVFFREMDQLAKGDNDLSRTVQLITDELKQEFQDNETKLAELAETAARRPKAKLENRQRLIAQYVIELESRASLYNMRTVSDLRQTISARFREFRKTHPEVARHKRFRDKERELLAGMRGRSNAAQPSTIAQTMKQLSRHLDQREDLGPAQDAAHPGQRQGAIQDVRMHLQNLMKLNWVGERIRLDRAHWDTVFAGRTAEDIRIDVNHMLQAKGITLEDKEDPRMALLRMRAGRNRGDSNVVRLFLELRGDGNGGFSRGGAGGITHLIHENPQMRVKLSVSETRFDFALEELAEPARIFRLLDSDAGGLQLTLLGDMVHRFQQRPDGSVSLVEIIDDQVVTHKAESLAQLYRDQPEFIERRFLTLLDHLGVIPPSSRFDSEVIQRLEQLLSDERESLRSAVDDLVRQLDSPRFHEREAAYQTLRENLVDYYDLLSARNSADGLSREAEARISRLLELSEQNSEGRLDPAIAAMGLVYNPGYLREAMKLASEPGKVLFARRIQELDR